MLAGQTTALTMERGQVQICWEEGLDPTCLNSSRLGLCGASLSTYAGSSWHLSSSCRSQPSLHSYLKGALALGAQSDAVVSPGSSQAWS